MRKKKGRRKMMNSNRNSKTTNCRNIQMESPTSASMSLEELQPVTNNTQPN